MITLETNQILQGDVIAVAKTLPDQSVNTIITSPAYWGLRDYQTGEWVGGDEDCDHKPGSLSRAKGSTLSGGHNHGGHLLEGYPHTCAKCGAIRKDDQIGMEATPEAYVAKLVEVFGELRRVLRDDGTCWLNLGSSYAGQGGPQPAQTKWQVSGASNTQNGGKSRNTPNTYKTKDLIPIPWLVALALQADGWWLRSDIIWEKPNPMPESVTDRPTKAHEYIFLLTKKPKYWFDQEAIREPLAETSLGRKERKETLIARTGAGTLGKQISNGVDQTAGYAGLAMGRNGRSGYNPAGRNKRSVWSVETPDEILSYLADKHPAVYAEIAEQMSQKSDVFAVATSPFKGAHFACFPPKLIEPCILAGCPSRVCVECGEPWVRVVEKSTEYHGGSGKAGRSAEQVNSSGKWAGMQYGENIKLGPVVTTKTLGHAPTCQCNAGHRPGIVLDPFIGSGTTAQVAIQNKRHWLGIELNPDYIKLAMERIHGTQPALFTSDAI